MNQKPSVGRIINVVLRAGGNSSELITRPAIIVRTWGSPEQPASYVNVQVFTDMTNDGYGQPTIWMTSVRFDEENKREANTWHWPPRV